MLLFKQRTLLQEKIHSDGCPNQDDRNHDEAHERPDGNAQSGAEQTDEKPARITRDGNQRQPFSVCVLAVADDAHTHGQHTGGECRVAEQDQAERRVFRVEREDEREQDEQPRHGIGDGFADFFVSRAVEFPNVQDVLQT